MVAPESKPDWFGWWRRPDSSSSSASADQDATRTRSPASFPTGPSRPQRAAEPNRPRARLRRTVRRSALRAAGAPPDCGSRMTCAAMTASDRDSLTPSEVPAAAYDDEYYLRCCLGHEEWRSSEGTQMAALYPGVLDRAGLREGEAARRRGCGPGRADRRRGHPGRPGHRDRVLERRRRPRSPHARRPPETPGAPDPARRRAGDAGARRRGGPRHDDRRDRTPDARSSRPTHWPRPTACCGPAVGS